MIIQMRVDERLVHGQVTTQWSRILSPDVILVINDQIAGDKITSQSLLMAQPAGIKVRIRSVAGGIKALKDPRADTKRFMIIVNNLKDAITLMEELHIQSVNVANLAAKKAPNKTAVTSTIRLTQEDLALLRKLTEMGEDVFYQLLPMNNKENMKSLLKQIKE